jgi:hypothetical protein
MKRLALIAVLALWRPALAEPIIIPTNFLDTEEPARMCQNYIRDKYGELFIFTQPTGGALARIPEWTGERCLYIFCEPPTHRLIVYALVTNGGARTPYSVKVYGRQVDDPIWTFDGGEQTNIFHVPIAMRDSVEHFDTPVDVAVSSRGRYFELDRDRVYVLDQLNRRIVMLQYSYELDSLIWVGSFGQSALKFPTAIAYADYGDTDCDNDDLYVTDAGLSSVLRFSANGAFETSYGGWGRSLASISFPSGVAVSTSADFPNRIFVSDSHNHRVVRYISSTSGPIVAECQYIYSLIPWPLISGIDTDAEGNVHVVNSFSDTITVLMPSLDHVIKSYGGSGYEPGRFDYPVDIYIDGEEMQICELFADSSGIQSFRIQTGQGKLASEPIPQMFQLFQNYPNPFNPATTIMFEVPQEGHVRLAVYNILGQRVRSLVTQPLPAGRH